MSDAADRPDRNPITWQCPHCREITSESEQGIRAHINNADDGPHEGLSGWDLERHIPGYDLDGHLVAAIRASTDQHSEEAVVPAEAIHNADWHHEFARTDEPAPSSDPSQVGSDEDSPPPGEIQISLDALDELQTVLAHYREAGKRMERLAEPGSVLAARGQARWHTASRFIEMFDSFYEDTDDRPAQAGHDREL